MAYRKYQFHHWLLTFIKQIDQEWDYCMKKAFWSEKHTNTKQSCQVLSFRLLWRITRHFIRIVLIYVWWQIVNEPNVIYLYLDNGKIRHYFQYDILETSVNWIWICNGTHICLLHVNTGIMKSELFWFCISTETIILEQFQ